MNVKEPVAKTVEQSAADLARREIESRTAKSNFWRGIPGTIGRVLEPFKKFRLLVPITFVALHANPLTAALVTPFYATIVLPYYGALGGGFLARTFGVSLADRAPKKIAALQTDDVTHGKALGYLSSHKSADVKAFEKTMSKAELKEFRHLRDAAILALHDAKYDMKAEPVQAALKAFGDAIGETQWAGEKTKRISWHHLLPEKRYHLTLEEKTLAQDAEAVIEDSKLTLGKLQKYVTEKPGLLPGVVIGAGAIALGTLAVNAMHKKDHATPTDSHMHEEARRREAGEQGHTPSVA